MEQEEKRLEESRDTNVQQMNNSEKGTVAARGFRPVIVRRSGARERVAAEAATEQKGDQSVHKRRFMLAPTLASAFIFLLAVGRQTGEIARAVKRRQGPQRSAGKAQHRCDRRCPLVLLKHLRSRTTA